MRVWKIPAAVVVWILSGCNAPSAMSPDNGTAATGTSSSDAAALLQDSAGPTCGTVPTDRFCAMEGCNFRSIKLDQCDEAGGTYDFYGPDFCTSQLTLLVVFAEWCEPCREEAPLIQQLITEGYAKRGVRVLSVMAQNVSGAPTASHCRLWRDKFQLTSHMMIDPMGLTQVYFPMMAFPANILVNRNGQIVYRAYGTSAGLSELRQQIDTALGPGI